MAVTVAFIGQSNGRHMFAVSANPPVCPAGCTMLNLSGSGPTWVPVTGNGAIEYARRLQQTLGEDIQLINACWDGSALLAANASPSNLYWLNPASDGPLQYLYNLCATASCPPDWLEWNQGEQDSGSTSPTLQADYLAGLGSLYTAILAHFCKTAAQMPLNLWVTGKQPWTFTGSTAVMAAQIAWALANSSVKLGASSYDLVYVAGEPHLNAFSYQIMGARAATIALGLGTPPRIASATWWGQYVLVTISGARLLKTAGLTGFTAFVGGANYPLLDARVIDGCTIRLVLQTVAPSAPTIYYQPNCFTDASGAVHDTQTCFVKTVSMPLVPCPAGMLATAL